MSARDWMTAGDKKGLDPKDFGYLQLPDPEQMSLWPKQETQGEKFKRKCKENPFVPLGKSTCF